MKPITLLVTNTKELPEEILSFTPEENYYMLKIGCDCLLEGRKVVAGLTQNEIYQKIRNEHKEDIQKLELDLLVQKELNSKIDTSVKGFYENQVDHLNKQIEMLRSQIKVYESENRDFVKTEVEKVQSKFDILLDTKDKTIDKLSNSYEKLLVNIQSQNSKSTSHKGSDGEKKFEEYASTTFLDFKGFQLVDKHTQGGEGDFHLHFEDFDVLVDAKNYKKGVPSKEREKIKNDLLKNEHIHFAWLVSLNTTIDTFDRSPIMFEWITTSKCVLYINNLLEFAEPTKILRTAWFICKELCRLIGDPASINDTDELTSLKEKQYKMNDKVRNMRKTIREINTSIGVFKKQIDGLDYELKEILDMETSVMLDSNYAFIDNWWLENIVMTSNSDDLLVSTDIWIRFRQENKEYIKELDITPDKFRKYITSKLPMTYYTLRGKGNSAIDIRFVSWKEIENTIENVEKEITPKQTKKKGKEPIVEIKTESLKLDNVYLDETIDNSVIESYNNSSLNIMEISKNIGIKTFQVVSILVKYKVIKRRMDARGYDIYKETDEYKQKIDK